VGMQETESAARQEDVWVENVRAARAQGLGLRADAGQAGLDVRRLYECNRRLRGGAAAALSRGLGFVAVHPVEAVSRRRLHFPGELMSQWAGAADLALIERPCRLGPGAP
jgi:hypothetical protein